MAELVLMTALSPTMEEGTIASWSKKEGDTVSTGDVLCEVETDKATMEYEATQEGTLLKIVVTEGSSARVGDTIAVLGESGESFEELLASAPAAAPPAPEEPSTAETTPAGESAGVPAADGPAGVPAPSSAPAAVPPQVSPTPAASGRIKATPVARKLAAARNVDILLVPGSGPDGRVTKADVENFRGVPTARPVSAGAVAGLPGADERIPVTKIRSVIARRLSESKFSAPHFYLKSSAEVSALVRARSSANRELDSKVSFNAYLMKFAAEALRRHPAVNAGWQETEILQFGSVDIGLAVDVGNGLITPIVRNCANKGVVAIDAELQVLIEKARNNALAPEEYNGATFTISNLGSFGIEEFTAIINPPGSAILAVGKTIATPVVDEDGDIVVANLMKLTLSCDHRVIDGALGARFLRELTQLIEEPARMVL